MDIRWPLVLPVAAGPNPIRRANHRHTPVERRARLAWEADRRVHEIPVRLLDISRGGAAVEIDADAVLPPIRSLQFSLGGSRATDVVLEATAVQTVTTRLGGHRIHLAFTTKCPDAVLKRALFGARKCATMSRLIAALASTLWSVTGWARRARR
ncbi:MAG: PilZ domain-containing protein [Isosphaeraceae bacterium]